MYHAMHSWLNVCVSRSPYLLLRLELSTKSIYIDQITFCELWNGTSRPSGQLFVGQIACVRFQFGLKLSVHIVGIPVFGTIRCDANGHCSSIDI